MLNSVFLKYTNITYLFDKNIGTYHSIKRCTLVVPHIFDAYSAYIVFFSYSKSTLSSLSALRNWLRNKRYVGFRVGSATGGGKELRWATKG